MGIVGDQGNAYYFGKLSNPNTHTVILKFDQTGSLVFEKLTELKPQPRAFSVSQNETFLYAFMELQIPAGVIVEYSGTTGLVELAISFAPIPTSDSLITVNFNANIFYFTEGSGGDAKIYSTCPKSSTND